MISAHFPIAPVAWQRPRFNGNRAFTAPIVRKFETQLKRLAMSYAPMIPMAGALYVEIILRLASPKRTKNRHPCVRPDIDNYSKVILDSLNEIFWFDDGQVVKLTTEKLYCTAGEKPSISVLVMPMIEDPIQLQRGKGKEPDAK